MTENSLKRRNLKTDSFIPPDKTDQSTIPIPANLVLVGYIRPSKLRARAVYWVANSAYPVAIIISDIIDGTVFFRATIFVLITFALLSITLFLEFKGKLGNATFIGIDNSETKLPITKMKIPELNKVLGAEPRTFDGGNFRPQIRQDDRTIMLFQQAIGTTPQDKKSNETLRVWADKDLEPDEINSLLMSVGHQIGFTQTN